MAISGRKITAFTSPVSSLTDQPSMSAADLKAAFDSTAQDLRAALNGLIDDLVAGTGAGEIGSTAIDGLTGNTVALQIAALMAAKVAGNGIKGMRLNAGGNIEVTLDGTSWQAFAVPGAGDMLLSVFDPDHDGVLSASALPAGTLTAKGAVKLASDLTSTAEDRAATPNAVKLVNDKALSNINRISYVTTTGTAPNYVATYSTALESLYWPFLVRFHADAAAGSTVTLNVNGSGAFGVFQSNGKYFCPKQNQFAWVVLLGGTGFFVCSAGGLDLPGSPTAGNTVLLATNTIYLLSSGTYTTYTFPGAGYGFTAVKAGTYRISYSSGATQYNVYMELKINDSTVVPASAVTSYNAAGFTRAAGAMDVTLNAGDTLKLYGYAAGAGGCTFMPFSFIVSMLAADLQTALNGILTVI